MLEKILRTPNGEKINRVLIANSSEKQLIKNSGVENFRNFIKLRGTLTSQIQLRGEKTPEPYYYAFVKLKSQSVDLPTIFKIKDDQNQLVKPHLKKYDEAELTGNYSTSPHSIRKSFTCLDYIRLLTMKKCLGCKDKFTSEKYDYCATCPMPKKCVGCRKKFNCFTNEDYDYCSDCEINGSRYIREERRTSFLSKGEENIFTK